MTIEDPDVSSYQGVVDWALEKAAGVDLGACKATEGTGWTDPTFPHNWQGIHDQGMAAVAYHYAHPGNDIAKEVAHFRQVVGPLGPRDHIAMDLEAYGTLAGAAVPQWGLAFCMECERQFGVGPERIMVYTGRWFIDATGGPAAWQPLTCYGYWYSAYVPDLVVERLAPWASCVLWQNTDSSRQPGVHGVCDGNIVENGGYFTAATPNKPLPAPPIQEDDMYLFTWNGGVYLSLGCVFYRWVGDQWDLNAIKTANPAVKDLGVINGVKGFGVPTDPATAKLSGQPWPVTGPAV